LASVVVELKVWSAVSFTRSGSPGIVPEAFVVYVLLAARFAGTPRVTLLLPLAEASFKSMDCPEEAFAMQVIPSSVADTEQRETPNPAAGSELKK
jgi:hypothetical protein